MEDAESIIRGLASERSNNLKESLGCRLQKPKTVAHKARELAREAWFQRESLARDVAENAVFAKLAGSPSSDDTSTPAM